MRLVAKEPIRFNGTRLQKGDEFDIDEAGGQQLIASNSAERAKEKKEDKPEIPKDGEKEDKPDSAQDLVRNNSLSDLQKLAKKAKVDTEGLRTKAELAEAIASAK